MKIKMKAKYKKYTNDYMEYLAENHNRLIICRSKGNFKLCDFLHFGYWYRELRKRKLQFYFKNYL